LREAKSSGGGTTSEPIAKRDFDKKQEFPQARERTIFDEDFTKTVANVPDVFLRKSLSVRPAPGGKNKPAYAIIRLIH
jgi:hypothetical protein